MLSEHNRDELILKNQISIMCALRRIVLNGRGDAQTAQTDAMRSYGTVKNLEEQVEKTEAALKLLAEE